MPKVKIPQNISDWFKEQGILEGMTEFLELENKVTPVFLVNPEGFEGYVRDPYRSYVHKADAVLSQAAPVSTTWYTILDTTLNCRLIMLPVSVATANETLEVRITADGVELVGSKAATAGTAYYVTLAGAENALEMSIVTQAGILPLARSFIMEAASIKVEIRKTTALGAGILAGKAKYAILP